MNVLSYGRPFGTPGEPLDYFVSRRGHQVRRAAYGPGADYQLRPGMTASALVAEARRDWEPELLLCWCPEIAPPPPGIEDAPIPTVAVVSDWTVYGPQLEHNLARYDAVAIDRLGAARFHPYGVTPHYVGPLYAHRSGVHRSLDLPRDIDIAFAGNLNHAVHVRRGRLLECVAAFSGQYHVVIASELAPEAYTELMNRTRIAFNCSLRSEMNLRCFEAVACGALLFIEASNIEVGDWLKDGGDVVRYTPENLGALLETHLSDAEKTARMAARAYEGRARLAGENRLDDFIDAVAALPPSGRPFKTLSARDRAMAELMQYASSGAPGHAEHARWTLETAHAAHPGDAGFNIARAAMDFTAIEDCSGAAREAALRETLDRFRDCATANPENTICWLNLAFVTRMAKAAPAERRFLELALEAPRAEHGGLLMGARRDPHYQRWREGLALGDASISVLWAGAAARLAELHLEAGETGAARVAAERSIALAGDLAPAHLCMGRALLAEGRAPEAAEVLRASLPLTALDSAHRNALIDALDAAGARGEAADLAGESALIFDAWTAAHEVARAFRMRAGALRG